MLNKDNSPALETESVAIVRVFGRSEEARFIRKRPVRALIQVGHFAIFHHTQNTIRFGPSAAVPRHAKPLSQLE